MLVCCFCAMPRLRQCLNRKSQPHAPARPCLSKGLWWKMALERRDNRASALRSTVCAQSNALIYLGLRAPHQLPSVPVTRSELQLESTDNGPVHCHRQHSPDTPYLVYSVFSFSPINLRGRKINFQNAIFKTKITTINIGSVRIKLKSFARLCITGVHF